jgi:hypothetical protein
MCERFDDSVCSLLRYELYNEPSSEGEIEVSRSLESFEAIHKQKEREKKIANQRKKRKKSENGPKAKRNGFCSLPFFCLPCSFFLFFERVCRGGEEAKKQFWGKRRTLGAREKGRKKERGKMEKNTVIVAGAYERSIVGFEFLRDPNDARKGRLKELFSLATHEGCVKSIAAHGNLVVSGSSDETMK